jgi:hypothetical protein
VQKIKYLIKNDQENITMEILLNGGSVEPGQEIKVFFQLDNCKHANSSSIRAVPLNNNSLITSDLDFEGKMENSDCDHLYSVSVKNIGKFTTNFMIVSSDKN